MKTIYLDNAATTPMAVKVFEAMIPYLSNSYFNPSATYDQAQEVRNVLQKCRDTIAKTIGCDSSEIYFTSGGTESDNWALRFVRPGHHIITSKIEHHAVLNTCKYLETQGVEVTYLDVDEVGMVNPMDVEKAIKDNTILISIMMANNEIGTIQPVLAVADIAAKHDILMHTDAVQTYGHIPIDVNEIGVDMMSVSAHKFRGPKGVGFLYISNRIPIQPMIFGGGQQGGKRSGTENVAGIVGMTKAAEIACNVEFIESQNGYIRSLSDYMQNRIRNEIGGVRLNGSNSYRLANNINMSFSGVRGEQLVALLSMNGICASTGSACDSSSGEPSHVLKAIGLSDDEANSSIRFTMSGANTKEEIDYVVDVLKDSVENLRSVK